MTCNIKTRSIHLLFLILVCGMAVVSCRKDELNIDITCESPCEPLLKALSFKASSNPYQLVEDVRSEIIGDSMAECRVGHMVTDKVFVPHIEFQGDVVLVDGRHHEGNLRDGPLPPALRGGEQQQMGHALQVHVAELRRLGQLSE